MVSEVLYTNSVWNLGHKADFQPRGGKEESKVVFSPFLNDELEKK